LSERLITRESGCGFYNSGKTCPCLDRCSFGGTKPFILPPAHEDGSIASPCNAADNARTYCAKTLYTRQKH
jgi:hypothetical protein